ncbi:MAG: glycosyltransferase family 87 protein [Terriglobales bacterium]
MPFQSRFAGWLTVERVRRHAMLLAVCIWGVYAFTLATPGLRDRTGKPKGTDFLHFYTLGSLAVEGRNDALYDARVQADQSERLVPESKGFHFLPVYGPQVALLFSPLARLSYGWAALVWISLSVLLYAWCCGAVWKTCPALQQHRGPVALLAVAYPAFFNLVAHGQTSALALFCFTAAYLALGKKKPFLAGLAIGMLIYKPQLGLAAAFVFLFAREWKVVAGAILAAAAQLAIAWAYFGRAVMETYWQVLNKLGESASVLEPKLFQMHSLRSFWMLLVPWEPVAHVLYMVTAALVLWWAFAAWRSRAPLSLRYSAFLLATVLVTPHLTVYDLVILAPALLLLGDWALANAQHPASPSVRALLYLGYALPLLGAVTQVTHVQLSVVAFAALAWTMRQVLRPYESSA